MTPQELLESNRGTAYELTVIKSLLANLLNTALLIIEDDQLYLLAKATLQNYINPLPEGDLIQQVQDLLQLTKPNTFEAQSEYAVTINRIIGQIRNNIEVLLPKLDLTENQCQEDL